MRSTGLQQIDAKLDQINATLAKLLASGGTSGSGSSSGSGSPEPAASCKEIYDKSKTKSNRLLTIFQGTGRPTLRFDDAGCWKISVYCHMSDAGLGECCGGGWTLVMKIDGSKNTFHYDSSYWSDKNDYGLPVGATALDTNEVKLPSYWNTPFTKICLGMEANGQRNFIVFEESANSLYSLIADGEHRDTFLGRDKWKTLIGTEASLQTNCNQEGFNSIGGNPNGAKARIGIIGNQENDCNSCDSRIGFGTGGSHDDTNTCGNEAAFSPDNGNKHIKAMGYILVQ
ncbi:hypothetical protein ACROYT_G008838 [Oculina patagonica]